ncbi:hypothetical protein T261_1540 [Streptomyces lydicus]|nr:hypothetical protein T261_1540 [Streptomyces lydicus]
MPSTVAAVGDNTLSPFPGELRHCFLVGCVPRLSRHPSSPLSVPA